MKIIGGKAGGTTIQTWKIDPKAGKTTVIELGDLHDRARRDVVVADLDRLISKLDTTTGEDARQASTTVKEARDRAASGDESGVLTALKKAGRLLRDLSVEVTGDVLAAYLKKAAGMPG